MGKFESYPQIVDLEDSLFVVETSAGTRRMTFAQLADYFQNIINNGGISEAINTANQAMNTATEASNTVDSAVANALLSIEEQLGLSSSSLWQSVQRNEYREDSEEYTVPYVNIGVPNKHSITIPKLSGGKIAGWLKGSNYRLSKLDVSEYIGKKVRICGTSRSVPAYPCAFCTAADDLTVLETYGNDSNTVYGYTIEHPELTAFQSKEAIETVIPQGAKYLYIMGALSTNSGTVVFDAVTALEVPVFDKSIVDAVKELQSPLLNKRLSVDGDSICYGNGYLGGFGKIIADKYNMSLQNNAVGGATIAIGTVNALSFNSVPDWNNEQYYLKISSFDYINGKDAESQAFPISQDEYINGFGVYPTVYKLVNGELQEQPYSETMPAYTFFIKFDIPTYDENSVSVYYRMWNIERHRIFWECYHSGFGTAEYVQGDTQLYTARHWLCRSVSQLDSNSDYIVIEGGINEYFMGRRLGTITEDMTSIVDITTTVGAAEYMCRQLLAHFADKKILFVITHKAKEYWRTKNAAPVNGYTLQEYYDAIAEVMKKYSIPYVNLSEKSRLNTELEQFLAYTHNSDGVHPNKEGYDLFYVPLIMNELEKL